MVHGLCLDYCAEHVAPTLDLNALLPDEVKDKHNKYLTKHVIVDVLHAEEVDKAISELSKEDRKDVDELIPKFGILFENMIRRAANIYET